MNEDSDLDEIREKKMEEMKEKLGSGGNGGNSSQSDPIKLNSSNFETVINENNLVVVDAWAEWCGPCKMMDPVIEELAEEYSDISVGKLNVDDNQEIAAKFGIRSIPTLLFFKNGELVDRSTGALPKDQLKPKFEELKSS
ncbi:MAG: Thioredoxin [Candidatus Methanohalarchaeum thermophilum]|uniref:Thioredoxin n=1 Tax=Methanohalarchaeum thermophilum TaxID=1903181 RepID=A0A1Q6DU79_METT1|nr:MAG: Thioredoxin [Candidatus Methanohalarchaeum thermophilum]